MFIYSFFLIISENVCKWYANKKGFQIVKSRKPFIYLVTPVGFEPTTQ